MTDIVVIHIGKGQEFCKKRNRYIICTVTNNSNKLLFRLLKFSAVQLFSLLQNNNKHKRIVSLKIVDKFFFYFVFVNDERPRTFLI